MPVLFSVDLQPPDAILRISGELDLAARDRLRRHLADLRHSVHGAIRIDLADVTFVDCTCLRAFEEARLDLAADRRCLHLTSPQRSFRLICELAGYAALLRLTEARRLRLVHPRRPARWQAFHSDPNR